MRITSLSPLLLGALAIGCARGALPGPAYPAVTVRGAVPSPTASVCATDFDSVYAILTRDYSGYNDRMAESAPRIAAVADSVRAAVRTVGSDSACTATIERWTALFREHDHHLQFWQLRGNAPAAETDSAREARRPRIHFADDSTAVITLPNFARRYKPAIDSLVAAHRDRLLATPFLVVDLRRNPGGADASFRSVMTLLYTNPIPREGFDVWVSEGTIADARPMLADPQTDEATKTQIRDAIRLFETRGKGYLLEGTGGEVRYDTVYAMPRAVAVVTGRGCASSCEQFVLDAMHSRKVTVFGTTNTAGLLDYGNVRQITLPSGIRRLATPSTRSRRLPHRQLDKTGIAPHVVIPKTEPDLIAYATRYIRAAGSPTR
jgi:hypothetical protein